MISDREYNALIASGDLGRARAELDERALHAGCLTDSGGKPLRLYHGTPKGKFMKFGSGKHGIYMTTSLEVARYFANMMLPGMSPKAITHPNRLKGALSSMLGRLKERPFEFDDLSDFASFLEKELGLRVALSNDYEGRKATLRIVDFPHDDLICHEGADGMLSLESPDMLPWFERDLESWVDGAYGGNVHYVYAFSSNKAEIDAKGKDWKKLTLPSLKGAAMTVDDFVDLAFEGGRDCVIVHNVREYNGGPVADDVVVKSPNQIKSCDLVTEDDEGNVIPLSKRFSDSDDIREEDGVSEWLRPYSR